MRMNRKSREYQEGYFQVRNWGCKWSPKELNKRVSDQKAYVRYLRNRNDYVDPRVYNFACGLRDGYMSQVKQKEKRVKRR